MNLWNIDIEKEFLDSILKITRVDMVFEKIGSSYFFFSPKQETSRIFTPNGRNAYVGNFTETWCEKLLNIIARENNLYAVTGAICPQIGLTKGTPADLVFSTRDAKILHANEIKMIFEIKMGIVNNYKYDSLNKICSFWGDYTEHKGVPSFQRSDNMLKAIGKSCNIRSYTDSLTIPIIILGNAPITSSYTKKVDNLKTNGIIQNFISLYPNPTNKNFIIESPKKGFITIKDLIELKKLLDNLLAKNFYYFSSMKSLSEIGQIILVANKEATNEAKGAKFLELLK